jgi:hypothetical protein
MRVNPAFICDSVAWLLDSRKQEKRSIPFSTSPLAQAKSGTARPEIISVSSADMRQGSSDTRDDQGSEQLKRWLLQGEDGCCCADINS